MPGSEEAVMSAQEDVDRHDRSPTIDDLRGPHDLARITVPTTLIWGRHDRGVRLNVAEVASERYGWPLRVIEDARDDPAIEQPQAFLQALRTALDSSSRPSKPRRPG
jgi:pimeloyl-ACP methyl ester carboxylesterase